jgi:serine/threonine protein phosphatase PrpC
MLSAACAQLVALAYDRWGDDNITVIIVQLSETRTRKTDGDTAAE